MPLSYEWGLAGHKRQRQILERETRRRRSHAFLFYGPPDIGKRRLAERFGAILRCEKTAKKPCFSCISCDATNRGIDILRLEPQRDSRSITIEQMREFIRSLHQKALLQAPRIGYIFQAHRMHTTAANALLKHLEEPAQGFYFILVADTISRMPATVLSRCSILKCNPYSLHEMQDEFRSYSSDPSSLAQVLAIANGRVEFARGLLNHGLPQFNAGMAQAVQLLTAPFNAQAALIEIVLKKNTENDPGAPDDEQDQLLIDYLELLLRDILLLSIQRSQLAFTQTQKSLEDIHGRFAPFHTARMLRALKDLRYTLERNGNARLAWEHFILTTHAAAA